METTTPTILFDDGSAVVTRLPGRAQRLSSSVVVVSTHDSPNHEALMAELAGWDVPVTGRRLEPHQGIRHVLELCSRERATLVFVPDPGSHRGQLIRKCVQSLALASSFELPALTVYLVRDRAPLAGEVALVADRSFDDGFADLVAVAFARSLGRPLRRVLIGPDGDAGLVRRRAQGAAEEAATVIAGGGVAALDVVEVDGGHAASDRLHSSSVAVVGFGGFDVRGRKWTAPDELPDAVLQSYFGHIVHGLADAAPCDLVLVLDAIRIRHGAATGALLGLVAGSIVVAGSVALGHSAGASVAPGDPVAAAPAPAPAATDEIVATVTGPFDLVITNPSTEPLTVELLLDNGGPGGSDVTQLVTVIAPGATGVDVDLSAYRGANPQLAHAWVFIYSPTHAVEIQLNGEVHQHVAKDDRWTLTQHQSVHLQLPAALVVAPEPAITSSPLVTPPDPVAQQTPQPLPDTPDQTATQATPQPHPQQTPQPLPDTPDQTATQATPQPRPQQTPQPLPRDQPTPQPLPQQTPDQRLQPADATQASPQRDPQDVGQVVSAHSTEPATSSAESPASTTDGAAEGPASASATTPSPPGSAAPGDLTTLPRTGGDSAGLAALGAALVAAGAGFEAAGRRRRESS